MFEEGGVLEVAMWLCEAQALIANMDPFFRLLFMYGEFIGKKR